MRGVNFCAYKKKKALEMWIRDKQSIDKVCSKFKCVERSLWRWKRLFDGSLSSLEPKTSRKDMIHPNSHTFQETETIKNLFKKNPRISFNEAYGILRTKHAYSRSYGGFYNFVVKSGIRPREEFEKYIAKPYETPDMLGGKWQMDVKYVPIICYKGEWVNQEDREYYQYTMIDETTRERFIYPYKEHTISSTLDFVKRAIAYFGYVPEILQTDNGLEFTNHKEKHYKDGKIISTKKVHALDILLNKLSIKHQLIRAYTPRLNGKVERSHRSDQEGFYNYMKFKNLDDLKKQMLKWLVRYNNRPHSSLRNRDGKRVWWSPIQKRNDLLKLLEEKKEEYHVRFLKSKQMTLKQIYVA